MTITARVTKTKTTTIFTPWKTNQNKSDKSTMRLHSGSSEMSTFHFRNCLAIYKSAIISSMSKKYYKKIFHAQRWNQCSEINTFHSFNYLVANNSVLHDNDNTVYISKVFHYGHDPNLNFRPSLLTSWHHIHAIMISLFICMFIHVFISRPVIVLIFCILLSFIIT